MKIIALEEHTVPQFIDHAWHGSAAKQDNSLWLNPYASGLRCSGVHPSTGLSPTF